MEAILKIRERGISREKGKNKKKKFLLKMIPETMIPKPKNRMLAQRANINQYKGYI